MSKFFEKLIRPILFQMPAERAHELGIEALRSGLFRPKRRADLGKLERFGLVFESPLGIAAGFDKNGRVVDQLAALGFGFIEVGTVTLDPQPGNEKPRIFRLPDDGALINRLGFNNHGADKIVERLQAIERNCVVGVNIGKNKTVPNEEAVENYLACFEKVFAVADYIAINISSPNTPNLRQLQRPESLHELLAALQGKNKELSERLPPGQTLKPLLVKIAPDLAAREVEAIVDVCIETGASGIIATNTTTSREGLTASDALISEGGGLSGRPLEKISTEIVAHIYRYSDGKLPIIGVGGIFTPQDALEKIMAGACLIQAYTGFVYGGPSFAAQINSGLVKLLEENGFDSLDDAIGHSNR